jgi:hypothetical protein
LKRLILVLLGGSCYRNSAKTKQAAIAATIPIGRWKPARSIVLVPAAEPRVMVVLACALFVLAVPDVVWAVVSFVASVVIRLEPCVKKGEVLFEFDAGGAVDLVMLNVEMLRYV